MGAPPPWTPKQKAVALALPLASAIAACGGDDSADDPTTTQATTPETTPDTTSDTTLDTTGPPTTTVDPVGIASFAAVQPAVIQIEAKGTFRDPEIGYADGSGRGSGFIISPDGLAPPGFAPERRFRCTPSLTRSGSPKARTWCARSSTCRVRRSPCMSTHW
jgi:hypothetical protein